MAKHNVFLLGFILLTAHNFYEYFQDGFGNVSVFIVQVVLLVMFLRYGGADQLKLQYKNKVLKNLVMTGLLFCVPTLFFGFLFPELFALGLLAMVHYFTNVCPYCDTFLRSGEQDILFPKSWMGFRYNAFGFLSPMHPEHCLNCGKKIDYKAD